MSITEYKYVSLTMCNQVIIKYNLFYIFLYIAVLISKCINLIRLFLKIGEYYLLDLHSDDTDYSNFDSLIHNILLKYNRLFFM